MKTYSSRQHQIKEECGIFGIFSKKKIDIPSLIYYGLFSLQHRGQEGAGIVISNGEKFEEYRDQGSVGEVFSREIIEDLKKFKPMIGIGHVRYSTSGSKGHENIQPLVSLTKVGPLSIAHNGNLINDQIIREKLENQGMNFYTSVDSESILKLISLHSKNNSLINSISKTCNEIKGAFSLIIMSKDKMIGLRDPSAIRPLCLGQLKDGGYILSSESCAIDVIGGKFIRDLQKGEMVVIDEHGIKSIFYNKTQPKKTCIFEYVYFARPDSTIDGVNCYLSRIVQGKQLYIEHPLKADMVIAAPDSGVYAAEGYAQASGIPYGVGLIKNRYIARTFIKPTKELRERSVYIKLNPLAINIKNKTLILVDDSIVRGTTSYYLVNALKKAGAKKVYLLSASPMIKWPCYLGIDTPNKEQLMAANFSLEQMKRKIRCDYLGFLSLKGLIDCVNGKEEFCTGCFDGKYPVRK